MAASIDHNPQLIAKLVDDGAYFTIARQWYNDIFLRPVRAAAWMTALSLSFAILAIMTLYNLSSIFPIYKKINVVVFMNDTINYYARLANIGEKNKSTRQVVMEYLCSKYVTAREAYISEKYYSRYYFIVNCSSKEIFDQYYDFVSPTNPNSPLVLHKNNGKVTVKIISQSSTEEENSSIIRFIKKTYNNAGVLETQATFEANLSFYLSNYDFTKSTNAKLDFIVTKYDVKEITA